MSVSTIASSYSSYQTTGSHKHRTQELEALQQALQSGNLSGAQQAFSQLQQNAPSGGAGDAVITDISALGTALSAGDISSAQTAFATLQQDIQNAPPLPPPGAGGSDGGNDDQLLQAFSNLASALQNGDLSAAQSAFATLESLSPDNQSLAVTTGTANSTDTNAATSNTTNTTDLLSSDLSALSDALQNGDLASAQSAFQTLLEDLKSNALQHHHNGANVYAQNEEASTASDRSVTTNVSVTA